VMVGAHWDFAWHRSIGRDMFFTPPHIVIQTSALLAGFVSVYTILMATFAGREARDSSVRILGLQGPAGAFMMAWGSVAMVASAPFDNWWHNAFGLDVRIASLPHILLSMGYFVVMAGGAAWIAALMNRSEQSMQSVLVWLFLIVGGLDVVQWSIGLIEPAHRPKMHTAACYLAAALYIPYGLIAFGRGSSRKWGCTIIASIYTGIELAWVWLLPFVSAQPKLGPVYHNVTHLIPLEFPLLMIVPALVADLLLQRLENRSPWIKAVTIGPAFLLSFLAAQWPFASFLMSPASRNWIFGTAYFPYADPAGVLFDPYQFEPTEKAGSFLITMAVALAISILAVRLGLAWGGWMRRVRR
jgi:hypothetical protein